MDIAKESAKKGITLSCLGIGSQWNDEFLDSLAIMTGGSSEFAANPHSIKEFLNNKFGQISNNYANNVILEFNTPPEVELRYAFRLTPDIGSLVIGEELPLGDIPLGGSLSVLMEFMINSVSDNIKEFTLADGNLRLTIPSRTIPQTNSKLSLSREVTAEAKPDPPPQVLVKAMSRLSLYRMQEQAQKDLAEGDISKATQKLRNLSTRLLSSGQPELARTVLLEVENIQNTQLLDEAAQKKIKYGTRALVSEFGEETDL
jgi:Ca-activated chloride channel family protein